MTIRAGTCRASPSRPHSVADDGRAWKMTCRIARGRGCLEQIVFPRSRRATNRHRTIPSANRLRYHELMRPGRWRVFGRQGAKTAFGRELPVSRRRFFRPQVASRSTQEATFTESCLMNGRETTRVVRAHLLTDGRFQGPCQCHNHAMWNNQATDCLVGVTEKLVGNG
jgi:hypothetical protein